MWIDIIPPPLMGLDPIRVLEFGATGYQRNEIGQITGRGRTGGNVTRVGGPPKEHRYYTYQFTARLDYERAMAIHAIAAFQQERLDEIAKLQASNPAAGLTIDYFAFIHDNVRRSQLSTTPRNSFVPGSEVALGGMAQGFPIVPALLTLPEENDGWQQIAYNMIELTFTATELRP
ncbi:MAG: hypothetical protein AAGF75_11405 [Cyanobacteria bacterium P01_H01_bin.130]